MGVASNIRKLYVIKASKWTMLYMPTIVLFFQENGLSLFDIMLLQAIYSLTIAITEVPSGYLADILGKRKSMIVGTFLGFIGMIIYSYSSNFMGFVPAALSLAIGHSFLSGSDTALMYDSLLEINRQRDFLKMEGRTISLGNFAEAIAFVIGGFLADISLRTPFFYQIFIAAIGFIVSISLTEPSTKKLTDGKTRPIDNMKKIINYSLFTNGLLRYYILYSAVIGVATLTMAWFVQPYLKLIGIELIYFGIIGAILNLIVAIPSFYSYKIEKRIKTNILLTMFLIIIVVSYISLGYYASIWSLGILAIFYVMRGIATPVLRDYMNRNTPSEMRATVMSIRSFIIRIAFAITSPILGYSADVFSLTQTLALSGLLFLFFGIIVLFLLLKFRPSY